MQKIYSFSIIIIGILLIPKIFLSAQELNPKDTSNPNKIMDTLCFRYQFIPNDTLIYTVNSFDSITVNFGTPVLKNRIETWQIVCKQIDEKNRFIVGIKLIDFKSREKELNSKTQEVLESPWLNQEVLVTIDSLGDRYYNQSNNTNIAGVGPGGAFQPLLLFPFLRGCKPINQTWIVNSTDTLLENAYPPPLMKQVSLFRLNPVQVIESDTCATLEFVKSGQGVFLPSQSGIQMNISSIINSFGELFISLQRNLPVKLYTTIEQKLTIHLPEGQTQSGFHFISSIYHLTDYKKYFPPVHPINKKPVSKKSKQR